MDEVNLRWDKMEMKDPVFSPSSLRTAAATLTVTPAGVACTMELYFSADGGVTKAATSGQQAFTSTGVPQVLSLPVTTPNPSTGQAYGVYLIIQAGGLNIGSYRATDDVIIPVVGTPSITWG